MKHAIPANLVDFPLTSWLTGGHALLATHNPLQRLLQQRGNMKLSDGARWRSWPASQWERSTSGGIRLQAQLAVLWETAEAKFDHLKWMKAFEVLTSKEEDTSSGFSPVKKHISCIKVKKP